MLNGYYLERNLANPFINFPKDKKFTVFAVKFINNSKDRITFNPTMSGIFEEDEKPLRPLDITEFYFLLVNDPNGEARMQIIKRTAYDIQFILKSGERKDALLVFPAIDLSKKVVNLILKDVYLGHKWTDIPFTFDVIDISKKK